MQEALAQEAEVPRLHQLRAEASVDSIPAPPNVYTDDGWLSTSSFGLNDLPHLV